jgi:hypothetical protein
MEAQVINPAGREPETNRADECSRCDTAWGVQFDGENLCRDCFISIVEVL